MPSRMLATDPPVRSPDEATARALNSQPTGALVCVRAIDSPPAGVIFVTPNASTRRRSVAKAVRRKALGLTARGPFAPARSSRRPGRSRRQAARPDRRSRRPSLERDAVVIARVWLARRAALGWAVGRMPSHTGEVGLRARSEELHGDLIVLIVVASSSWSWILIYNGLVQKRLRIDEAFAQIEVQLKRR